MATASGNFYGEYSKQSRLRLYWEYTQDKVNNCDYFYLALYAQKPEGTGTHNNNYNNSTYWLTSLDSDALINGTGNYSWANNTELFIGETVFTNKHNDNGISGDVTVGGRWFTNLTSSSIVGTNMSVSGVVTNIPTIPRYAKVSASVNKTTINSITINWSTDSNVDRVQYKLNSGAWVDVETNVNKSSGSFIINGLTPNTSYTIGIDTRRKDSGLWSSHGNKGASLSKITKQISIVSGRNFDLGSNENITYTNPNDGSTIQVGMFMTDGTTILAPYRIVTGTSYTFEFTDEELDKIYKAFGASENLYVRIYSKTALNNTEYSNYANIICNLTGNQKTGHINVDGVWKRTKRWTNVDGIWKRCVRWINVDGNWKRCI